jgi:hypothetical protein
MMLLFFVSPNDARDISVVTPAAAMPCKTVRRDGSWTDPGLSLQVLIDKLRSPFPLS